MLLQIFHACKNTANFLIEEIMDASVPFTRKKQSKPSPQNQSELKSSDEDELPDVKLD